MDLPQFIKQLEAKQREIDDAMRRKLPIKVGRLATDHYHENFRKGGFVNGGLHPWQQTRRQQSGSRRGGGCLNMPDFLSWIRFFSVEAVE